MASSTNLVRYDDLIHLGPGWFHNMASPCAQPVASRSYRFDPWRVGDNRVALGIPWAGNRLCTGESPKPASQSHLLNL